MLEEHELLEHQGSEKMTVGNEREDWVEQVDTILKEWCQGDYVLGEHWFVHRFNPQCPLTQNFWLKMSKY